MPVAIKRRKVSATAAKSTRSSFDTKPRTIDSFTRVTKAKSSLVTASEKKSSRDIISSNLEALSTPNSKKRKSEDDEEGPADYAAGILEAAQDTSTQPIFHARTIPSSHLIRTSRQATENIGSLDTPTKGTRGLLDGLFLTSETPTDLPLGAKAETPDLTSGCTAFDSDTALPDEILDLINLHAAFLTALSLHYAHNGTEAPADLRLLCPDVARAWGKRAVKIDDIRRTLGVLNKNMSNRPRSQGASRLSLSDYGHKKICVEIDMESGLKGRLGRPVNENLLHATFVRGLNRAWEERPADTTCGQFVQSLPLEPITTCSSVLKMSPLLLKGQQRLEDLKMGIVVRTQSAKEELIEAPTKLKATLLERLQAKQILRSALPSPPSAAELSRRCALQKMDEVAAVLTILSTSTSIGQQRISFTLPTVFGKLGDSLKTPMSKKESDICVRLLAAEIAPEWLRLVKMGKVEALVFDREGKPSASEFKARVLRAGDGMSIFV